jgi:hypothetical protein
VWLRQVSSGFGSRPAPRPIGVSEPGAAQRGADRASPQRVIAAYVYKLPWVLALSFAPQRQARDNAE